MSVYSRTRIRRALVDTVAFRAVSQVATILGYIVMVRSMSELDFGVYHLLYAVIPIVSVGASLGLEQVLRRFQPEFIAQGKIGEAQYLVRFVGRARLVVNAVVLSAIYFGWSFISPVFKLEPYHDTFALFAVLVIFILQLRIFEFSLSAHMLQRFAVGLTALVAVLKAILYTTFEIASDLTLIYAILSDLLSVSMSLILITVVHRKYCSDSTKPIRQPAADDRRRMFRYGLFSNFNDAGTLTLNSRIDNLFIAAILEPLSVGAYSFYSRLAEMVRHILPVNVFINVVRPVLFAVSQKAARDRIPRYFSLLVNSNLIVQLPLTAMSFAFHEEIVKLIFGGKFLEYSWLLPMFMLFGALNTIANPVILTAQYTEKTGIILLSKGFGAVNILLLISLIPIFGIYGACLASAASALMKNLFIWWNVRDYAKWKNAAIAVSSAILFWGGFVLVIRIGKDMFPEAILPIMFGGFALCSTLALLSMRFGGLSDSDREIIGDLSGQGDNRLLSILGVIKTTR